MCLIIQSYIRHQSLRQGYYSKLNIKIRKFIKSENSMASKFMRNLMVVMIYLVIFILMEVQANKFTPTFFHLSSLPNWPPSFDTENTTIHSCIEERVAIREERVKEKFPEFFPRCIVKGFRKCLH